MAYDARAMDADPKVGLPSSSLLYRVDGWREREIDEQGAPALTYIVNCTYTTRIAQMGRTGRVCAKKDLYLDIALGWRPAGRVYRTRRGLRAGGLCGFRFWSFS